MSNPTSDQFYGTQKPVAQYNPATGEWSLLVEGQWVRIDYLIESLIETKTILEEQYSPRGQVP